MGPEVPVTVKLQVPGVKELILVMVISVVEPGTTGLVLKLTVVPGGFPLADRLTGIV